MQLRCEECNQQMEGAGWRWRAYRCDLPDDFEPDDEAVAFYCPPCALRVFDDPSGDGGQLFVTGSGERDTEPGEHRQVGLQPDTLYAPDAEER